MFRENNRLLLVVIDTAEGTKKNTNKKNLEALSLKMIMIPVLVLFSMCVYSFGHACV